MKITRKLLLLLIVSGTFNITVASDLLYVSAKDGINLREEASTKSQVLKKIPYGMEVQSKHAEQVKDTINNINGQWIKISYGGYTGFVFDAYLSRLPLPVYELDTLSECYPYVNIIENYLFKAFSIDPNDKYNVPREEYTIVNPEYGEKASGYVDIEVNEYLQLRNIRHYEGYGHFLILRKLTIREERTLINALLARCNLELYEYASDGKEVCYMQFSELHDTVLYLHRRDGEFKIQRLEDGSLLFGYNIFV